MRAGKAGWCVGTTPREPISSCKLYEVLGASFQMFLWQLGEELALRESQKSVGADRLRIT